MKQLEGVYMQTCKFVGVHMEHCESVGWGYFGNSAFLPSPAAQKHQKFNPSCAEVSTPSIYPFKQPEGVCMENCKFVGTHMENCEFVDWGYFGNLFQKMNQAFVPC